MDDGALVPTENVDGQVVLFLKPRYLRDGRGEIDSINV